MRIAIISTPRSGNTWLRYMLSDLYRAEQIAVHSPCELDWSNLPENNFILQLHWHNTPQLKQLLNENEIKVVVLQRHILDVLISILQFAHQEPQTSRWLNGEGGDEKNIYGKKPSSKEFLAYAVSNRAAALFKVSAEWSVEMGVICVKYEDLVKNTGRTLSKLTDSLGLPCENISEVVADNAIETLRGTSKNGHFWQGCPALWKELIPTEAVMEIAERHKNIFSTLGYDFPPSNTDLTVGMADEKWRALNKLKDMV